MSDYDDDYGLPPNETISELDARYNLTGNLTGNKHVLHYQYDGGDDWEHIITVERRRPGVEGSEMITGGKGHSAAEDVGGAHGWQNLKKGYEVKDTPQDTLGDEKRRRWYERQCSNGDAAGLKGMARLEHVDLEAANQRYKVLLERMEDDEWDKVRITGLPFPHSSHSSHHPFTFPFIMADDLADDPTCYAEAKPTD
ncbi:uncharacterized protein MKK02DRAFT_37480 [Dioszegia hungarica]|uniref:Plasmid pRiA4b Orf3-like domain-containing protein n=1 Tax=Dioszegia hungarica TaxID=4972 RepID=A0AA38LRN5_9TREE|nr:uncharacterized protein MKK02DRAFT_37480 [Dioszegia hungarica]KAI9634602.1 hypothetical protein MKK02DRAFT_37480 [Dioszegia hungarica]